MTEHVVTTEKVGMAESAVYTPICSCGWKGRNEYAYEDYCHTNLQEQKNDHIREMHRKDKP